MKKLQWLLASAMVAMAGTGITAAEEPYNLLIPSGDWKTEVTFVPANGLTDNDNTGSLWIDASNSAEHGWTTDQALSGYLDAEGNVSGAYVVFDLGRACNVTELNLEHSPATSTAYTVSLYGTEGINSEAIYSKAFTAPGNEKSTLVLPFENAGNVRYLVITPTALYEKTWGCKWLNISLKGTDSDPDSRYIFDHIELKQLNFPWTGEAVIQPVAVNKYGDVLKEYSYEEINLTNPGKLENIHEYAGKMYANPTFHGLDNIGYECEFEGRKYQCEATLEYYAPNWERLVNIARVYSSNIKENFANNGFTLGNPKARAWASAESAGGVNETATGLIDGDWMAWTISSRELEGDTKPYVVLDLGYAFPVNEFAIHWNADAQGDWRMLHGNYVVYAAGDTGDSEPTQWKEVYRVDRHIDDYDVDRHMFETGDYRYLKFEFLSSPTGSDIAINEITVTGPSFVDEAGNLIDYPQTGNVMLTTPTFDRSNPADRSADNNWIVTSTGINQLNPLALSYMAVDCYGRSFLKAGQQVVIRDQQGNRLQQDTDRPTVKWRDIDWPRYPFNPDRIGQTVFTASIVEDGATVATSEPLTVYTFSQRHNINSFAYPYDNAKPFAEGWNDPENPDKSGDRDINVLDTAPRNASDGSYGSWYVIGYYGPASEMGLTYKYPANHTLENPYELVLDFRGVEMNDTPKFWASELDMIGVQFEGAFARDYDVYLLHIDGDGKVRKTPDGKDDWGEPVTVFTGLRNMGIGQVETQRIYPADKDGKPLLREDGKVDSWKDVAAVKFVLRTTGTQYGFKIYETAIYGKLNANIVNTQVAQKVFTTPEATEEGEGFWSFDLKMQNPLEQDRAQYDDEEYNAILADLDKADNYRVKFLVGDNENTGFIPGKFNAANSPLAVSINGTIRTDFSTDSDGALTINVAKADIRPERDGEESRYITDLTLHNVDPSKWYMVSEMTPYDAAGNEIKSLSFASSRLTNLHVPGAMLGFGALNLDKSEVEVANYADLVENDGQSQPAAATVLGGDDMTPVRFHRANKLTLAADFSLLPVTNSVLDNYTLSYAASVNVDGTVTDYSALIPAGARLNTEVLRGSVDYLSPHTVVKTAAQLFPALAEAPADVRDIPLTVIDPTAGIPVHSETVVTYTAANGRGITADSEKLLFSNVTDAAPLGVSQADVAHRFAPWQPLVSHQLAWALPSTCKGDEALRYDAFIAVNNNDNVDLNNYVGFYFSNDSHSAFAAEGDHDCADGSFFSPGGLPLGSITLPEEYRKYFTDYVIPGYEMATGDDQWNPESHSFGWNAAKENTLALRLHHVGEYTKGARTSDIPEIFGVITSEYPLQLAEADADGNLLPTAATSLSMSLANGNESMPVDFIRKAGSEAKAPAASSQGIVRTVTAPIPVTIQLSDDQVISGVGRVDADKSSDAPVNVYNLQGILLRSGADCDSPLEGLPAGIYIVNGEKTIHRP